jgi:hypothetical protein
MIVTGVSCFGLFLLDLTSIASLALGCSKLVYTSSVTMWHADCVQKKIKCVSSGIYHRNCTVEVYCF